MKSTTSSTLTAAGDDPGLQNERTALAWQRTSLSVLACASVIARLTVHEWREWAILTLGFATAVTIWIFASSRHRYRRSSHQRMEKLGRSGALNLALVVLICLGSLPLLAIVLI
ncbi:DUF202 domain-containing protein [Rhodococcus sp. NPDC055024]